MIKKIAAIISITFFCLVFFYIVKADDLPRPKSKLYTSENRQFVFVLLLTDSELNTLKNLIDFDKKNLDSLNLSTQKKKKLESEIMEELIKEEELRKKYQKSGLYERGNPQSLIWSYDWQFDDYIFGGNIQIANDAKHLVQKNGWIKRRFQENSPDWEQEILCFVVSGKKIRSYKAKDLIFQNEKFEATTSGYYWNRDNGSINNKNKTFSIRKVNGENLIFNFENGDLIEGKIPLREKETVDESGNQDTNHSQNIETSNKNYNSHCFSVIMVLFSLVLSVLR